MIIFFQTTDKTHSLFVPGRSSAFTKHRYGLNEVKGLCLVILPPPQRTLMMCALCRGRNWADATSFLFRTQFCEDRATLRRWNCVSKQHKNKSWSNPWGSVPKYKQGLTLKTSRDSSSGEPPVLQTPPPGLDAAVSYVRHVAVSDGRASQGAESLADAADHRAEDPQQSRQLGQRHRGRRDVVVQRLSTRHVIQILQRKEKIPRRQYSCAGSDICSIYHRIFYILNQGS